MCGDLPLPVEILLLLNELKESRPFLEAGGRERERERGEGEERFSDMHRKEMGRIHVGCGD